MNCYAMLTLSQFVFQNKQSGSKNNIFPNIPEKLERTLYVYDSMICYAFTDADDLQPVPQSYNAI